MPSPYQEDLRAILGEVPLRTAALETLVDGTAPASPNFGAVGRTALLQHSSGSTGLKRGVALSHAQFEAQVVTYPSSMGIGGGDRIVS